METCGMAGGRNRAALLAVACGLALASPAQAWPWDHKDDAPKIPRWAALKFNEVNARSAPGDTSRILFVYRARGLPLQILAETREWRRVCDSDGVMSWVKATTITDRRTVLRKINAPAPLRADPAPGSRVVAYMAGRSTAELRGQHGAWTKVRAGGLTGWLKTSEVWGTDNRPQCR